MRTAVLLVMAASAYAAPAGEWRVVRAIDGAAGEAAAVAAVALDGHVFANSQEAFADVRVLDAAGREVPRVIAPRRTYAFEERGVYRPAQIKSLEQLPDGGLAVVCELPGTNAVALTALAIDSPLRNYEQTVAVYAPDDAQGWRLLKGPEPLFDYSRFADVRKTSMTVPTQTGRLFRLVIGQADDKVYSAYSELTEEAGGGQPQRRSKRYSVESRPFRIDAVRFLESVRVAVEKTSVCAWSSALGATVSEDRERRETVVVVPTGLIPVRGLALAPEQQNFERRVTVERPVPGGWQAFGGGVVRRSRLPGLPPHEALELVFGEVRAERLRARIQNDDNPPLQFPEGGVKVLRPAYDAVFIAEKGQPYRLAYGNPDVAESPVYEQGVTDYLRRGQSAVAWRLGPAPEGAVTYGAGVRLRRLLAAHGIQVLCVVVVAALALLILRAARHANRNPAA